MTHAVRSGTHAEPRSAQATSPTCSATPLTSTLHDGWPERCRPLQPLEGDDGAAGRPREDAAIPRGDDDAVTVELELHRQDHRQCAPRDGDPAEVRGRQQAEGLVPAQHAQPGSIDRHGPSLAVTGEAQPEPKVPTSRPIRVVAAEPAQQYSAAAAGAGDGEEMTVATARAGFVSGDDEPEEFSDRETLSIDEDELDDQAYLMEEPDEEVVDADTQERLTDYSSSSLKVPAQPEPETVPIRMVPPARPSDYVGQDVEVTSSGGGSRVLSALLFLLLGGVLGAGAYYFWLNPQPEPPGVAETPVITDMKSTNPPLTFFEEGRRLVDKNPQAYLNNAPTPQDAEDYFLVGRAQMLTGKYWEAKRSFTMSRDRLASADPNNAKTLAAEISMALAIIESPQAEEKFTRDITTANAGHKCELEYQRCSGSGSANTIISRQEAEAGGS